MRDYLLLLIVGRICEESRVKSPNNRVRTIDNYTVQVRFNEFIIYEDFPLSVNQLSATVCHQCVAWTFSIHIIYDKILERIRKLSFGGSLSKRSEHRTGVFASVLPTGNRPRDCISGNWAYSVDISIHCQRKGSKATV